MPLVQKTINSSEAILRGISHAFREKRTESMMHRCRAHVRNEDSEEDNSLRRRPPASVWKIETCALNDDNAGRQVSCYRGNDECSRANASQKTCIISYIWQEVIRLYGRNGTRLASDKPWSGTRLKTSDNRK